MPLKQATDTRVCGNSRWIGGNRKRGGAAAVSDLVAQQDEETGVTPLMQAAERLILEDMPFVPIYIYVSKHLIKPYVRGFVPNIMDQLYTKDLSLEGIE